MARRARPKPAESKEQGVADTAEAKAKAEADAKVEAEAGDKAKADAKASAAITESPTAILRAHLLGKDTGEAGEAPALTAAEVAEVIDATVRDLETGEDGKTKDVTRKATAADILAFGLDDGVVTAVTIDGQKHRVEIA